MTAIADIVRFVTDRAGHRLNGDEGVQHGPPDREAKGVTVAWMATAEVIESAGRRGDQLVIGHESLFYPYDVISMPDPPAGWEDWLINRRRREALDRHGLSFLRVHGSLDEICVLDDFAAMLELGKAAYSAGWVRIFEIEPCSFEELVARVKRHTGMKAMRVARPRGDDRPIRRVGLSWGGMGLFVNVAFQQLLVEQKCDVFIGGESDCYAFRFATECGISVIETSHELSEIAGLRRFTSMLQAEFKDARFTFEDTPAVWHIA